jgi:serine/threonine protein kinase
MKQADENEELFATWLAACDDAMAAGTPPPLGPPIEAARAQGNLACARLLREVLSEGAESRVDSASGARVPAELPWKSLGRFELQRELGRGGCGVVYLAYDPWLSREVALKVARLPLALDPEVRRRFGREARTVGRLEHPNVVPVYEVGAVGPVDFIVSAYCPGPTLAEWLRQRQAPVPFATPPGWSPRWPLPSPTPTSAVSCIVI